MVQKFEENSVRLNGLQETQISKEINEVIRPNINYEYFNNIIPLTWFLKMSLAAPMSEQKLLV